MTTGQLTSGRPRLAHRPSDRSFSILWRSATRALRRAAASLAAGRSRADPGKMPSPRTLADIGLCAGEVAFAALPRRGRRVHRSRIVTQ